MIVAETAAAYRFVTQPAHASLAGQFADRWGGPGFERPAPRPAVLAAAYGHDDGWTAYDRRPRRHADGTPVAFTELPAETWIQLYDRGIDDAVAVDRYAGLLVSMHGTGLRRRRYGLSPAWPETPPAFRAFVDREEARQRALLDALADAGRDAVSDDDARLLAALHEAGTPPEGTTSRLWTNYALLQAWDVLSLSLCTAVPPPAEDTIAAVPRGPGEPDATLSLTAVDGELAIDPYPFAADPIDVYVTARTVPKAAVDSTPALVSAYYDAALEFVPYRLRSSG